MQVLKDEHQGTEPCPAQGHSPPGIEELFPSGRGLHGRDRWVAWVHSQEVPNERNVGFQLSHSPHPVVDLRNDLGLTVELLDAEVLAELIDEGQEGDGLAEG